MRVHSGELALRPATVIASERMDQSDGWRLVDSGELIHIDPEPRSHLDDRSPDPPA